MEQKITEAVAANINKKQPKNYVSPEELAEMAKRFGVDTADGDSLVAALDRIYVANEDQIDDLRTAEEEIAEQREAFEADLAARLQNGTIDEAQAAAERRRWKPTGVRLPKGQVVNLLVMGDPGGGKTSIIEQWGQDKGVKIVKKTAADITASVSRGLPAVDEIFDPEGKKDENGNILKVKEQAYLPSTFFDALDDDDYEFSVLFVDEINRGHADAESAILTLVCDHTINNRNYKSGRKQFNQYLFTVAACNPPANNPEARKLSLAMATRFRLYIWNNSPEEVRKFIQEELDNNIKIQELKLKKDPNNARALRQKAANEGRKIILDAIIDGGLKFSDSDWNNEVGDPDNVGAESEEERESGRGPEDIHVINARTLMTAIYACDGTVGIIRPGSHTYAAGSFMDEFQHSCTSRTHETSESTTAVRTHLDDLEMILSDVQDDMESAANGFQKTLLNVWTQWLKKNGAAHGLVV